MAVGGEVTFQAKLDTQIFDRAFNRIEGALKNAPVIEFRADIGDIYKAADAFTDAVSRASQFSQGMDVVSNQLGNAADRINGLSGAAITAANQFENAKAAAATLTGDADGLAASMKTLSKDLNFQASSTELLKASYDVLSAGFVSTADNTEILRASVVAAKGGFSDVGTVSDAVTTVLNAYGRSASDASKITDVLIQTQNLGKITVREYGSLIGQAATIASQAGVSFEEFSAFVSVATVKGVKAEASVAGLRQAISAILKPTKEASDLAQKLGVDFSASALKSKGLTGVLADLRSKGADSADTLVKLFGSVEAVTAIAPATGEGFKDLQAALTGISQSGGAAASAAEKVGATYEESVARALNQTNEALVSLGSGIKAAVTPLVQGLTFLVGAFNSLPEPVKQATGVAIALTGGLLTLGAVLAGVAAVIPAVVAGITTVNSLFVGAAAATAIQTSATTASTGATTINLLALQAQAAAVEAGVAARLQSVGATGAATTATTANTAATLASAQAQTAASAATVGTIGNLLKLAGTAALGAGAIYATVEAAKALETAGGFGATLSANKAIAEIDKLQSKLKEPLPKPSTDPVKTGLGEVEQAYARTSEAFKQQGPIEGLRTGLLEIQNAAFSAIPGFSGMADSSDKFGAAIALNGKTLEIFGFNLGGLTASQKQAQTAIQAFDGVAQKSGETLFLGRDLLDKFGLATEGAAQRALNSGRLTGTAAEEFKKAAGDQISVLDGNIRAIQEYGKSNPAAAEQVKSLTSQLEAQKAILQQRIGLLSGNKQSTQELQTSVADLTAAFEKNQAGIQSATNQAIANAKDQLSQRVTTEEEAQAAIFAAEKSGLEDRLAENSKQLDLLNAKKQGVADPAQLAAINGEILKLETDTTQTRIGLAEKVIARQKQLQTEAIADLQNTREKFGELADIRVSTASRQAKQSLLDNAIPEEEAQRRITEARKAGAEERIQGLNFELAQLRAARAEGTIDAETAAKKEREINANLRKEEENVLDARLELRRQFNQEQIRLAEEANAAAASALKRSQNAQTATIRKAVLDRNLTEEQAAVRLAALRQDQVSGETSILQQRLAENDRFEKEGIRTARDAAKIRRDLLDQLSQQQVAAIDAQLASQKALEAEIIAGIQKRLTAEKSSIDFKAQELELVKASGSQQLSLLDAQLGLQNALSELQAGRFQNALAEQSAQASADQAALARALEQATTDEDKAKIQAAIEDQKRQSVRDRVALEQAAAQQQLTALLQTQAIERQQLELKGQMQKIDADRAEKQAEIAVLEARAAVETAKARGASADELAILEKTVGLRQEQLKLASDNKGITDQQINLEQQAAATRQQTALEAAQSKVRQTQVTGNEQVRQTDFEIAKARIGRGVDPNDPTQKITSDQQKKIDLSNPINRGPNFNPNGLPPEVARTLSQQQGLPGQPLQPGQVPGAIAPGQPGQGQPVTEVIEAQPVFFVGQSVPLLVKDDLVAAALTFGLADIKQAFGLNPVTAPVAAPINPALVAPVPVQVGSGVQAKANQDIAAIATDSEAIRTIRDYAAKLNEVASTPRSISVTSAGDPIKEAAELWEQVNRGTVAGALM